MSSPGPVAMTTHVAGGAVGIKGIYACIKEHATAEELAELGKIVKCKCDAQRGVFAWNITKKLYAQYQTPIGYRFGTPPTLDDICDKVAKKLKLRGLSGHGWERLHSLAVNTLEKLLKDMPKKEKEELLKKMWDSLDPQQREELGREYKVADLNEFLHSSEVLVAHVLGVHLARETALLTAGAITRIYLGSELALAASTVLSRGAMVILGPLGWALLALSVNDLMGTNFKRVVPALMIINIVSERARAPHSNKTNALHAGTRV